MAASSVCSSSGLPLPRLPNSASQRDQANSGIAYQHILEHVLTYPGTYPIPLATMFQINSSPQQKAQQHPDGTSRHSIASSASAQSALGGKSLMLRSRAASPTSEATAQFTSCLISQIVRLPSQPAVLSPAFMASFLRHCFTADLNGVDFPKALDALDYMRQLEERRQHEVEAALSRLQLTRSIIGTKDDHVSDAHPAVGMWAYGIQNSERKAVALYTQSWLALRRWILINEFTSEPFNRITCMGMLNTLFPHGTTTPPAPALTVEILQNQRDTYFKWLKKTEARGSSCLTILKEQGKRDGDENGWIAVHEILDRYIRVTCSQIDQCLQMTGVEYFDPGSHSPSTDFAHRKRAHKADSGISFHVEKAENKSNDGSVSGSRTSNGDRDPHSSGTSHATLTAPPWKPLSTLEKIAREMRKLKTKASMLADNKENTPAARRPSGESLTSTVSKRDKDSYGRLFKRSRCSTPTSGAQLPMAGERKTSQGVADSSGIRWRTETLLCSSKTSEKHHEKVRQEQFTRARAERETQRELHNKSIGRA